MEQGLTDYRLKEIYDTLTMLKMKIVRGQKLTPEEEQRYFKAFERLGSIQGDLTAFESMPI